MRACATVQPLAPVQLARLVSTTVPSCFRVLLIMLAHARSLVSRSVCCIINTSALLFGYAFVFLQQQPPVQQARYLTAPVQFHRAFENYHGWHTYPVLLAPRVRRGHDSIRSTCLFCGYNAFFLEHRYCGNRTTRQLALDCECN